MIRASEYERYGLKNTRTGLKSRSGQCVKKFLIDCSLSVRHRHNLNGFVNGDRFMAAIPMMPLAVQMHAPLLHAAAMSMRSVRSRRADAVEAKVADVQVYASVVRPSGSGEMRRSRCSCCRCRDGSIGASGRCRPECGGARCGRADAVLEAEDANAVCDAEVGWAVRIAVNQDPSFKRNLDGRLGDPTITYRSDWRRRPRAVLFPTALTFVSIGAAHPASPSSGPPSRGGPLSRGWAVNMSTLRCSRSAFPGAVPSDSDVSQDSTRLPPDSC
jgi:hypothetical protein